MSSQLCRIMVVEDNDPDVVIIETLLEDAGAPYELHVCPDGRRAFEFIDQIEQRDAPAPDLLLLDLNVPMYSGEVILQRFRQCAKCAEVPVIVMSSSESPSDMKRAEEMGAKYFCKPPDLNEFRKLVGMIRSTLTIRRSFSAARHEDLNRILNERVS